MSLDIKLVNAYCHNEICEHCGSIKETIKEDVVATFNVTHNLVPMAKACGIYWFLWGVPTNTNARDSIQYVADRINHLESNPIIYRKYNHPEGYGTYEQFLDFLKKYLVACTLNPWAKVEVSS